MMSFHISLQHFLHHGHLRVQVHRSLYVKVRSYTASVLASHIQHVAVGNIEHTCDVSPSVPSLECILHLYHFVILILHSTCTPARLCARRQT